MKATPNEASSSEDGAASPRLVMSTSPLFASDSNDDLLIPKSTLPHSIHSSSPSFDRRLLTSRVEDSYHWNEDIVNHSPQATSSSHANSRHAPIILPSIQQESTECSVKIPDFHARMIKKCPSNSELSSPKTIRPRRTKTVSSPLVFSETYDSSHRVMRKQHVERLYDGALKKKTTSFNGVSAACFDPPSSSTFTNSDHSTQIKSSSHEMVLECLAKAGAKVENCIHQSFTSLDVSTSVERTCDDTFITRIYRSMDISYICSPLRKYSRRSSTISMMENQYFVPPPQNGTTLAGSVSNALRGHGVDFVVWIYQSSFLVALILYLSTYYALVCLFSGFLVALEMNTGGRCWLDDNHEWTTANYFELAFELSWATFTTVGYGRVATSSYEYDCYTVRMMCASFAFLGVLVNSLGAAIFFSKLDRFLTRSSINFSSTVCLQYGRALNSIRRRNDGYGQLLRRADSISKNKGFANAMTLQTSCNSNSNHVDARTSLKALSLASSSNDGEMFESDIRDVPLEVARASRRLPYPFLEFRIVNESANFKNREIRSAHATAMVELTPNDADLAICRQASSGKLFREYVTPARSRSSRTSIGTDSFDSVGDTTIPNPRKATRKMKFFTAMAVQEADSGAGNQTGPVNRVYFPLTLEPCSQPQFRRVWYIRHILNDRSPMLKPSVREQIKKGWDPSLVTYQDILASLVDFRKIRITVKGTATVNNSVIFAQKVYHAGDLFVGWQFGDIFYKRQRSWLKRMWSGKGSPRANEHDTDDDDLILDKRLIHDIVPQSGGGNEPIRG